MSTPSGTVRHQPQTITSPGMLIPADDLAQVAGLFVLLRDFLTGRVPPTGVRQPQVTRALAKYIDATTRAAREHEAARHRSAAFPDETGQIGSPTNLPARWDPAEEITVAQAADLTGYTPQYIRRLAQTGRIDGRQVDRDVWRLRTASVISIIRDSRKGAYDSGDRQAGDDGPADAATTRAGDGDAAPR